MTPVGGGVPVGIGPDIPDALRPPLHESEAVENYERPPARELEDRGPTATELRQRAIDAIDPWELVDE